MIDVSSKNVKDVMGKIHEAMLRKERKGKRTTDDIILESMIISVLCSDITIEPIKCADALNDKYGYNLTGGDIIRSFRNMRIANRVERKELFMWAEKVAKAFSEAILGDKSAFLEFESLRRESFSPTCKRSQQQDRIAAIMIFEKYPEIDIYNDKENLYLFEKTLSKYFFFDMSDAICDVYGFPMYRDRKDPGKPKLTYEQALRRIERLEDALERTNIMFQDLQDEF
ncbi:MAG: hypothetical protein IJ736_08005, partial [Firmicutes bacterium]|nr:hypothetical protein [Bacillota bacterium]